MLTLSDIKAAQKRINVYLEPTPLIKLDKLQQKLGFDGDIYAKLDTEEPTGSFKVRGAFNVLLQLSPEEAKRGVVTRSRGNFAQGVAYAAEKLNIKATIVMPKEAPITKIKGTEKYHAKVILSENSSEDGDRIVKELVQNQKLIPLHPYNDYRTMAGQGTVALEILQQDPQIRHFYCPIGGGGLLCGCATAFKELGTDVVVHGVEPAGAGDYHASRLSGKHEKWDTVNTISDGLRAASVGDLNYPILNKYVDDTLTVTDDETKQAMKLLYEDYAIETEPAGAVSFAGFIKQHKNIKGNVVLFISGKNVDPDSFDKWIHEV